MTAAPPMLPSPREVSLLTNVRPLPAEVAGFERWRNGLQFAGNWEGLDGVRPEAILCEGTATLPDLVTHPEVDFQPFFVNVAAGCAALTPDSADEIAAYARAALDANKSAAVETQLWAGTADATIPHLQAVATLVTGGPYSVVTAVARLLDARNAVAPSDPILIHGPAGMAPLLEQNSVVTRRNATLVGGDGWQYVPGAGYPKIGAGDSGPWQTPWTFPTGFAQNQIGTGAKGTVGDETTAQCYFYATGAIEYAERAEDSLPETHPPFNAYTAWDPRTNQWVVFAQQEVIYRFDPLNVFAILVTVPA